MIYEAAGNLTEFAVVTKTDGARGDVILSFLSYDPLDFDTQEPVFIYFDGLLVPFFFESFTARGNSKAIVRLTGCHNSTDAEEMVGRKLYFADDDEMPEGEGLKGWTIITPDGNTVGEISGTEDIPGNPCVYVMTPAGEVLVPLAEDLIVELDEDGRSIIMNLPDGLI